jgi:hypothetical protein
MTIAASLNESFRDALVAYYLGEVVPNDTTLADLGLTQKLRTENDLYELLLLDTQVTQAVETSPVASAIASLQQYVNGALLGMEPGYEDTPFSDALLTEWRDQRSQYPLWAANQQLAWYPSLYIDPSLRMKKSAYFQQLENDINQNRITLDTTQEAVQSYLASFEEVANLTIINGYIAGTDFKEATYYFIGKSRAEGAYYWRSVNMAERSYKRGTQGPKEDNPNPGAWSDWKKANLPISDAAIENTIRPVYFNNRLFVTWVERSVSVDASETQALENTAPGADGTYPARDLVKPTSTSKLRLNLTYKKYDDSWSAPQCYMEFDTGQHPLLTTNGELDLHTIAVADSSTSPHSLYLAVYSGYTSPDSAPIDGSADRYALLRTLQIDKNFNAKALYPATGKVDGQESPAPGSKHLKVIRTGHLFAKSNAGAFQFLIEASDVSVRSVRTYTPNNSNGVNGWNHFNWQTRVVDHTLDVGVTLNSNLTLTVRTGVKTAITQEHPGGIRHQVQWIVNDAYESFTITLVFEQSPGNPLRYQLLAGSEFAPIHSDHKYGTYGIRRGTFETILADTLSGDTVSWDARTGPADLTGKYVSAALVNSLISEAPSQFPLSLWETPIIGYSCTATTRYRVATQLSYGLYLARPTARNAVPSPNVNEKVNLHSTLNYKPGLKPDVDAQTVTIAIDPENLRPDWQVTWTGTTKKFNIIHGVYITEVALDGSKRGIGHAVKATEIELQSIGSAETLKSPRIGRKESAELGIAEFIDFEHSSIEMNDEGNVSRRPIRMNTLFARTLVENTNIALENLLSWETQQLKEPALSDTAAEEFMDFKSANGLYFWELFFHLPFLISHRLNAEQQFKEAEYWLSFIFDPSRRGNSSGRPDYWNVRPLVDEPSRERATRAPIDPDGIASDNPVHYRKAVYNHFIKNLLDRGDSAYRQLTPDALNEAKLWYVRVLDLLGPRPDKRLVSGWTPMTLDAFTQSVNGKLRVFERRLNEEARIVAQSAAENDGQSLVIFKQPPLALMPFTADSTVPELDNAHLRVAMNRELVQNWDTAEARLRNLRHNRSLDGKPLQLPLFAAPLDPRALLSAFGSGATGGGLSRLQGQEIPHYRFNVMHNRASNAVEHLIQFGSTLLSLLERKENAQLQEMQQQQAWEMAKQAITLQQLVQQVESEGRKALLASRAIAEGRLAYYGKLAQEVVNEGEVAAGALHLQGRVAEGVACVSEAIGEGLKVPPNQVGAVGGVIAGMAGGAIVGATTGGWRLEGVTGIATAVAKGMAAGFHGAAEALDRTEQYRRRHQEWMQAEDQAQREIEQIDAQLTVHDEQAKVTAEQLRQAALLVDQAATTYQFLSKRFTNAQLYQWLNGQFATFYYQAYDITLSLCLAAEACWQYEMADFKTRFIQPGAWKDSYRGLTAGESLKLNLMKMEAAYLQRNARQFEITKTVSVRRLLEAQTKPWSSALTELGGSTGLQIELADALFKADYPDHYLRRIKRVSVTLPAVLGPYEDIAAVLTQTYSKVEMTATEGENVWENMRASQQIALSRGVDDDGMFTLNFDDERYLPFEGTGAVSNWNLRFTRSTPELLASLSDVIVRVSYTAKTA